MKIINFFSCVSARIKPMLVRIILWLLPSPLIMKLSRLIFERVRRNKL